MRKIYFLLFLIVSIFSHAQLSVTANTTAIALANNLLGGGVTISSPTLNCPGVANGIFSNGATTGLGFNNGVVLSTGRVIDAAGAPSNFASTDNLATGIPAMGSSTYDGCYLGFQVVPKCNNLNIRYRFGSEEYNGYVGSSYNDAFGFFISGPNPSGGNYTNFNMATVPGSTVVGVAVNSINNGNTNTGPCVNCAYYSHTVSGVTMDGMTSILTASANVTPCSTYTLFMALVDRTDGNYDSNVFLEQSGVFCATPTISVVGAGSPICAGQSATLTASGIPTYTWSTGTVDAPIIVSPSSTTTYTISGSSIGGCIQDTKTVTVNVNNAPTPNAGSSAIINCTNPTVVLTGSGGGSYSWSGPGIISGGNTASPTVGQPGTYSVIVSSNTSPPCASAPATVAVTTDTTPPIPTATNSATITCLTPTATLTATGGGSYSWSGTGIVSGGNTANPIVNNTGPYVVTVTAANGCTATASTSVAQDINPPTPSASSSGTITCLTPTVTLSSSGGGTYNWSGTGIVSGGNTSSPVVNSTGPYVVTVTAANGCTASANVSVSQDVTPPVATASSSSTLSCATPTAVLSCTGGGTYSWLGTGIVSGSTTANPVVNATGPFTVIVTAANGCTASATATVAQNDTPPNVTASTTTTLTCLTTTAMLTATGGGPYIWSGTGIISGSNTANPIVNGTGPYVVSVTDVSGCTGTATVTVPQDINPPATTASNSGTLTCISTSITVVAVNGNTFVWSGPGIVGSGTSNTEAVNQPGVYSVTATAVNGCTAVATTTVSQDNALPGANISNTTIPCGASSVTLNGATSTTSSVVYSWTGPNAGSLSDPSIANPTAFDTGVYSLTVTNPANGCTSTSTIAISQATVTSAFTANPTTGISPLNVDFTNSSTGSTNFFWDFGDANTSTTMNPIHTFTVGTYTVTLTVTEGPCVSTSTAVIVVENPITIEIPNVFTPNDDGVNDVFQIRSNGIKEISLQIFNRWGQRLYNFTGQSARWDGLTNQGALVPEGTYFYFVKATGFDDKVIEQNGTVNLFK